MILFRGNQFHDLSIFYNGENGMDYKFRGDSWRTVYFIAFGTSEFMTDRGKAV